MICDGDIAVEERTLEAGETRAFIGVGEDIAGSVDIGEQALSQRAMREYAYALLAAEEQICYLDIPIVHIVARLIGVEATYFQGPGHLRGVVVGYSDIASFADLLQLEHSANASGDWVLGIPAMDLVEIDLVDTEGFEAVVHSLLDAGGRVVATDLSS